MDPDSILSIVTFTAPPTGAALSGIIAFLLLFISGFVSASEVAFFSLSLSDRQEVDDSKLASDMAIKRLLTRSDSLLASILIANNFVNVTVIILLEMFVNSVIHFGDSLLAQFLFQTIFLTFLLLLLGEIMPKIYASQNPLRFARRASGVLSFVDWFFRPVSWLLVRSTKVFNKRIMRTNTNISIDQLSHALELTGGEIKEEKEILQEVIKFGNKAASDVMTPRLDIAFIDIKLPFRKVVEQVVACGYSRIPVFAETHDHIEGILYAKDLLPYLEKEDGFRWQSIVRPPYFIPETKKIDDLLEEFQTMKIHLAIVVDEYGGTAGLVTLEDILEEIVGDISDEYDEEERLYFKPDENTYIIEAKIPLNDFFRVTQVDSNEFGELTNEADTLGGLLLEIKGNFPERREWIEHKGYRFQILEMEKRRIVKVKFVAQPQAEA